MTASPQTPQYRWLVEHRRDILTESLLVLLNFGVAVWLVDRQIPTYWGLDRALSLTVSFVIVQSGLIFLLLTAMFGLKLRDQYRTRERQTRTPEALALVTAIARGEDVSESLKELRRRAPLAVEPVLAEALSAQKGEGQRRLALATEACGALAGWRAAAMSPSAETRCEAVLRLSSLPVDMVSEDLRNALEDPEELVAVEAGRALLALGSAQEAQVVFEALPHQSVLVQALMLPSLRRFAGVLAADVFPAALASKDDRVVLMALCALRAWKRMVPVVGMEATLRHENAMVRVAALEALPYVLLPESPVTELRILLRDADARVQGAAATVAGRRSMTVLIPELSALLQEGGEPGRLAAASLASMGEVGLPILEAAVMEGRGAQLATEALERHRLGRGGL